MLTCCTAMQNLTASAGSQNATKKASLQKSIHCQSAQNNFNHSKLMPIVTQCLSRCLPLCADFVARVFQKLCSHELVMHSDSSVCDCCVPFPELHVIDEFSMKLEVILMQDLRAGNLTLPPLSLLCLSKRA